MDGFKIKYLGTAAAEGYPSIFCSCLACLAAQKAGGKNIRLRSSALINDELLVDVSPDFAHFKTAYDIDVRKLKTVLFTHTHKDHFYPDVFTYNCSLFAENPVKLNIYLSPYAAKQFRKNKFEKKEGLKNITLTEVKPFKTFKEGEYTITPLEAAHNTPQCLLYIIGYKGINMLYGNDTGMLTPNTLEYLNGTKLDIVSLDGTRGKMSEKPMRHMNFNEIISLKKRFEDGGICNKDTIFTATHFTHWINMLQGELEEYFSPYGIIPAYDGMEIIKTL